QVLDIMDLANQVNALDVSERKKYFVKFSNLFDSTRVKLRLSKDLKLITIKQYLRISEKHNEIIKLIYN
ncbi:MAG: hypothetical protein PHG49_01535, partial [Candidatus Pacebacteria bacterium]|nr:hypothetical protein [Candidatus Paceibacterota bacterium]